MRLYLHPEPTHSSPPYFIDTWMVVTTSPWRMIPSAEGALVGDGPSLIIFQGIPPLGLYLNSGSTQSSLLPFSTLIPADTTPWIHLPLTYLLLLASLTSVSLETSWCLTKTLNTLLKYPSTIKIISKWFICRPFVFIKLTPNMQTNEPVTYVYHTRMNFWWHWGEILGTQRVKIGTYSKVIRKIKV